MGNTSVSVRTDTQNVGNAVLSVPSAVRRRLRSWRAFARRNAGDGVPYERKPTGQGTGSYQSRLEKGWQRQIRLKAIQPPFQAPYLEMACTAYSEQVGR